ncbi:MAG: hypothetical protein LBJ70_01600 [Holosporales bacterium]|nr:hypothetical protein [Holosporales bacterium]
MSASSASTWIKERWDTIHLTYKRFRELIVQQSFEKNSRDFGVFELDRRSFGAKRVRDKRGRGTAGKTPFGLLNVLRKLKRKMEVREEQLSSATLT